MVCMHCKKNLPLMKRIVKNRFPFCSDAHRDKFLAESVSNMVERLAFTRDRFAVYRQPVSTQQSRPQVKLVDGKTIAMNPLESTN